MILPNHFLILFLLLFSDVRAAELTAQQIDSIKARLSESARASWEIGTRAEVLIEYDTPSYSVFATDKTIPPPRSPPPPPSPVVDIVRSVLTNRAGNGQFIADGSVADPASIGVAVMLAGWTGGLNNSGLDWEGAARDQVRYLLQTAPRTNDGAISHRTDKVQLWSDFMYMVPPFLAYYGAMMKNTTVLDEAYNQCKLYRQYLKDDSGIWKHIVLGGSGTDDGHWSTGNGWAAMGLIRVSATMAHSSLADSYRSQRDDLNWWAKEILDGMYPYLTSNSLFRNYPDKESSFEDASSTALIAQATYRLAILAGRYRHLPEAEKCRGELGSHLDSNGWLSPVVDPHNFPQKGSHSPEAQAFMIGLQASWRDWNDAGAVGAKGGAKGSPRGDIFMAISVGITMMLLVGSV